MNRKVKSVKVTRRQQYLDRFDSKELKELVFVAEIRTLDEQGRALSMAKYSRPDELEEKVIKSYDGRTITSEYYIDENELSEKSVTETDDNGKILRETIYYADGTESVSDFEYDGDKPVKKITMDVDEYERELSGEHLWTYDSAGNLLREEEFEYDELSFYREFKYDEKNRIISQTVFHAADGKPSVETMEWENDQISHIVKSDIHGNKTESFFKYNTQNEADHIKFLSAEFNSETVIEYDDLNNAVHEKETDDQGEVLYEVFREFHKETNQLIRVETYINQKGRGTDVHYVLEYEYAFY